MRSMSAVLRCTCPMSTPAAVGREVRSRGVTPGMASVAGLVLILSYQEPYRPVDYSRILTTHARPGLEARTSTRAGSARGRDGAAGASRPGPSRGLSLIHISEPTRLG